MQTGTKKIILSSAVIATIISSLFSCVLDYNNNKMLKDLENQKYQYDLQLERYEKLQEFLEYFASFKVYDYKFINRFDIDSDEYSIDSLMDIVYDSFGELQTNLKLMSPYLNDDSLEYLETNIIDNKEVLKKHSLNIKNMEDSAEVNTAVKEHLTKVNEEFDKFTKIIIDVLETEIHSSYVP